MVKHKVEIEWWADDEKWAAFCYRPTEYRCEDEDPQLAICIAVIAAHHPQEQKG